MDQMDPSIFNRSKMVARSPPPVRSRLNSLPDCVDKLVVCLGDPEKRKRLDDSGTTNDTESAQKKPREQIGKAWESLYKEHRLGKGGEESSRAKKTTYYKSYEKIRDFSDLLTAMVKEIKELRKVVILNQNTKVEIKRSSEALEDMAAQIETEKYLKNVQDLLETKTGGNVSETLKTTSTIATQTEPSAW